MTENQTGAVHGTAGQEGVARHAQQAAGAVASTGQEQVKQVAQQAAGQAKSAVHDMRGRVAEQAEQQAQRVSQQLSRIADELSGMADQQSDSMTAPVIRQVADTSRQAAGFLDERGARGMLDSVQEYARRKPGTFLLGAVVAGFLVGRVAKGASGAARSQSGTSGTEHRTPMAHAPDVTAPAPRTGEPARSPVATGVGAGRTPYPGQSGVDSPGRPTPGPGGMGHPGQSGVDPRTRPSGPAGMGYPGQTGVGGADETGRGPDVHR
ncbi:hypothetical protein ACQPZF_12965 [Actinosynnema sp. CS-041913]|uniref:hypothetical protein n=1 Tax=Actinosynnema sp. CS-041913 TaxID=3239917 RepID=UPI003D8A9B63